MFLIVGATGSLGGQVAKALLERGERVRAVVRPESPLRRAGRFTDPEELRKKGAELVEGDLKMPATLEPHLHGVKAVLFTASGTKRAPPDTTAAVDNEGVGALAAAAKRAGVDHLVYLSARGVGPDAPELIRAKWEGEAAIRVSGQPATVVRPALFMQDWIAFVLGAQLQGGTRVQLIGEREPTMSFVDEGDVGKLVTAVLLAGPQSAADRFEVLEYGNDTATHVEVVERMAQASGLPLGVERIAVGEQITTVPEPVAGLLTKLLTLANQWPHDELTSPELNERYGIEPVLIGDFIPAMFAKAAA